MLQNLACRQRLVRLDLPGFKSNNVDVLFNELPLEVASIVEMCHTRMVHTLDI